MRLRTDEPSGAPWQAVPLGSVVDALLRRRARPVMVAVDGRSASGKTTLSGRIASQVPNSAVVHTDDVAWSHAIVDWADLLRDGVLRPARRGAAITYRPPAWEAKGRTGSIDVAAGVDLLVVEGVGVARAELAPLFDVVVWVQSDEDEIDRRNARRIAAGEISGSLFDAWMAEEVPFLAAERPWERADLVTAGTSSVAHDTAREVVVGRRWWRALASAATVSEG
jgi:hypothetical protein